MNLVDAVDGKSGKKKKRGDVEVLEDDQDKQTENFVQFEANLVDDSIGGSKKKKKKKKKSKKANEDEDERQELIDNN